MNVKKNLQTNGLFLVLLLLIITSFFIFFNPEESPILQVHFIDVDQGDSILIQTPNRQNILIDGGEENQGPYLKGYLEDHGVKHLDMVIGTHPHADHIGGLPFILSHFSTEIVYLPPVAHTTGAFEELLTTLERENITLKKIPSPEQIAFEENLFLEFLSPHRDYQNALNNWSIVLKLTYENHSFLFTGDIESAAEANLIQDYPANILSADVLKVPHHGSSSSAGMKFLEVVRPSISIISSGKENPYGHPHKDTLDRLYRISSVLYRTDLQGSIVLQSDGQDLWSTRSPIRPDTTTH